MLTNEELHYAAAQNLYKTWLNFIGNGIWPGDTAWQI